MSEFVLYKSNGLSMRVLGVINKMNFFVVYSIIPIILFLTIISNGWTKELFRIILIILLLLAIVVLILYSGYLKKHIEIIGKLTVNASMIKKTVGGFEERFEYSEIKGIEVKYHIRKIFLTPNADKSKTYIVIIECEGKQKEKFVISSQSIDVPIVNFLDNVKWIEKHLNLELLKH